MIQWLLLAVFLILPLSVYAQPLTEPLPAAEPNLHVGILTDQQSIEVCADANFVIINTDAKVLGNFSAKDTVTIAINKAGFTINAKPVIATGIDIIMNKQSVARSDQLLSVNKKRYRGSLSLHRTVGKQGMTVINSLPLEQYLYGVVKNEISPQWPQEAVKAQVVAARTYALTNNKKHRSDGFDVCDTTDCQVYGGLDSETPKATQAVDATRGIVITYKGQLINAYFHSSSGGYTENSENVWSSSQPYLRGVADFDQSSPYFKWVKKLPLAELNQAIKSAGYNIGAVQAIALSPLTNRPVITTDRGVSGRVISMVIKGTNGTIELPGAKIRSLLQLKSTLFDIAIVKSYSEFTSHNYEAKEIKVSEFNNMLSLSEKNNISHNSVIEPIDTVIITGYGWGHGLGLSQWGAKAMAEKAPPGNTEYFKDILKHYYHGVEIKNAYK